MEVGHLRRRECVALLGSVIAWPRIAPAQSPEPPLVAWFGMATAPSVAHLITAFLQGMGERGYTHAVNFRLTSAHSDGYTAHLPHLAQKLVEQRPAVLLTASSTAVRILTETTSTIPIVGFALSDPVGASLDRPIAGRAP